MKKRLLALILLTCSMSVTAQKANLADNLIFGISYINLSDKDDSSDLEVSLGGVVGSLGYKIKPKSQNNLYIIPEFRLGTGIESDSFIYNGVNINIEMDHFIALSIKGQFELDNGLYLFATPAYANAKFTAKASFQGRSTSKTDSSWEFGLGGGFGYKFTPKASAELLYEKFDSTGVLNIGAKFQF